MIIVPPIDNVSNINADHMDVNDSLKPRVDMTAHDIKASIPVKERMEYHHPAIRRRDEPPHKESARSAVYVERDALILLYYSVFSLFFIILTSCAGRTRILKCPLFLGALAIKLFNQFLKVGKQQKQTFLNLKSFVSIIVQY